MKNSPHVTVASVRARRRTGFALVITLSLMVLLTLLAVGLLTLSSITLRASSQGNAMAMARSNARLALMLALGELQQSVGPDMAITATSEIISAKPNKPHLTGVWDSWNYSPNTPSLDYPGKKLELFRKWLVSDRDFAATRDRNYVTIAPTGETIQLVGARSLGATTAESTDTVSAGKVPIYRNGRNEGAYAWHVADEAVKARINAYRDPSQNQSLWQKRALLAGHRSDPSVVQAKDGTHLSFLPLDTKVDDYTKAHELAGKLLSLNQVDLIAASKQIAKFRHQVTLYSMGLPTNVREGGLKQDLSSMFGMSSTTLPTAYNNLKLYASTHKITGISDPYWSSLKGYYDVYKEPGLNSNTPVYYKAPQEAVPITQLTPPKKYYPAPVIARVEILFSFVVRESHGPWSAGSTGRPELTRMGHLLYAPIITLHNPYNVSLKFDQLDLDIKGIPMAFNFTVNDQPQNNEPVSFNEMFVDGAVRKEKSFLLSISNWSSFDSTVPVPITMKPGQTLVCGPYINGAAIFGNAGYEGAAVFFDYTNTLTGTTSARARCKPGFLGKQVSYDIDWLTLSEHASGFTTDDNRGVLIIKPEDHLFIEWKVKPNTGIIQDKMTVNATLTTQGTAMEMGGLEFDYDNAALAKNYPTTFRYPDLKSVPNYFVAENLYESNFKPISEQTNVRSIALLSACARNANGGVYDHGTRDKIGNGLNRQLNGRLAGRPFLHHNPARTPTVVDLKTDLPGRYSHELNVQPLLGNVDDIFNIDATNRGYGLTSNTVTRGIKSGSYLELPTGPLQTIADFRRSNALTSGLLPTFVQPVANSYASPLIATTSVVQNGVAKYSLLDHSVLANHALYDGFYFSTFATYGTKSVETVFTDFIEGTKPLLSQAFEPYLPAGKTLAAAKSELFVAGRASPTAYQTAAEYQLIRGAFNVNSTEVQAWKALLASMSHNMVQTLWATTATLKENPSTLIPIMPMSLVNGGVVNSYNPANAASIDNKLTNDWNGYRELTPEQLEELAEKIVAEVRLRGPFLSMSEFVNRRIGPESDLTRKGALQAAIDNSTLNQNLFAGAVTEVRLQDVADEKLYKFATPNAAIGNPAAGAPGWLSQGDLLRILEPGATVRADTFVIRVCGEAHDDKGRVSARAYAEAVVQRIPEYVNPLDRPSTNVWSPNSKSTNSDNKTFGRRLSLLAFRWLADSEV
ncbi:MAG: hypothetical protein NTW21_33225 [Verrucomicrobia bacterium]|nr:hypothetical protein [Verrucomicrobiota bacterium]